MSGAPEETPEVPAMSQLDYERITTIVTAEFQVDSSLLEHGIPTYYLKQPQETKKPFLRVLKSLESMNLIPILRKIEKRVVLRVVSKPPVRRSNIMINWILFFATIVTTFVTGYMLSPDAIDPYVGGASFTVAMLAVLGTHEMGHKITANKKNIDATLPYFIPGPPPLGTFGAVIMQKSLPPNRDALFDIGADGPIAGFVIATIVSVVGLTMLIPAPSSVPSSPVGEPFLWLLLGRLFESLNLIPQVPQDWVLLLHPVAFAGWVGILVTMLNLLPAGMLDGGHVARSLAGEKLRVVFTVLSILYLVALKAYVMAGLVGFLSIYKHPGPLDDVSSLSAGRKIMTFVLIVIFVLCVPPSLQTL